MKVIKLPTKQEEDIIILGATIPSVEEIRVVSEHERVFPYGWWLRSPDSFDTLTYRVNVDGQITSGAIARCYYVRPALIVSDISNSNFKVGDMFEFKGQYFMFLTNTLAWMCKRDIGEHYFDQETNIYENSHIKTVVDNWFAAFMKEEI